MVPATDDVAGVYAQGGQLRVGDAGGRPEALELSLTVEAAREFKGGLIVRFEGIRDRDGAEVLRGRTLLIRREETRPLESGEYFLHDLVGLEVWSTEGARLGRVAAVYEHGAGHFLGVDDGQREHLVPFAGRIVRSVDLETGRIIIQVIPGLLEL